MPRKKPVNKQHNPNDYIEIPLPKFSMPKDIPNLISFILVLALILAAFFLGVLTAKVQLLEKYGTPPHTVQK